MADEWRYSLHQRLAAHFGERGDALYSLGAGALAITVSAFAAFFSGQPNRRRVIHGVLITLDPNLGIDVVRSPRICPIQTRKWPGGICDCVRCGRKFIVDSSLMLICESYSSACRTIEE